MKFATFNICGAIDSSRRFYASWGPLARDNKRKNTEAKDRLSRIARFIDEESIDVVALQEVDLTGFDQATHLARLTEMQAVYGSNFKYSLFGLAKVDTGNAFLSKKFLLERRQIEFSQVRKPSLVERLKGSKKILVAKTKERIRVVSAHLTHNNDEQRELELKTLLEYCARNTPVVLMGDLNFMPDLQRQREFSESGLYRTDICPEILTSLLNDQTVRIQFDRRILLDSPDFYTAGDPLDKTVDYIIVITNPKDKVKLELERTYRPILEVSDHEPLVAEVKLK